jgi:hypothetical protein
MAETVATERVIARRLWRVSAWGKTRGFRRDPLSGAPASAAAVALFLGGVAAGEGGEVSDGTGTEWQAGEGC